MAGQAFAPGGSSSVGPASGGKTYAYNNIGVTPMIVAPKHVSRKGISFYNPGTIAIYIAPVNVQLYNSVTGPVSDVALTPSPSALGGCFMVAGGGGSMTIQGECQQAYQAFSASGANNPLTVLDTDA